MKCPGPLENIIIFWRSTLYFSIIIIVYDPYQVHKHDKQKISLGLSYQMSKLHSTWSHAFCRKRLHVPGTGSDGQIFLPPQTEFFLYFCSNSQCCLSLVVVSPVKHSDTKGSLCLSVCPSVTLFCHTFQSYVLQATHAFLGMLPLFFLATKDSFAWVAL